MNYLDSLNKAQKEAVTTTEGPVLVIAGAGSGKTRVIEHRVAHLIEKGVAPEKILLLTFTRRAASEMLRRACRMNPLAERVNGGTFHSFAYKMLRMYGEVLGISKSFSVLDEGDAEEAVHRAATQIGCYDSDERFPKKKALRAIIGQAFNKAITIEAVLLKEYSHFLHLADEIEKVKTKYAEYKMEKGYLDYDDLLFFLVLALQREAEGKAIAGRYSHIMVDEYQDTNRAQGDIAYLLARGHRNVMVVGDDAQSIYGFRGASHENIMEFPRRFRDTKIIKLEENYRSTQKILNVANEVLNNMVSKYAKRMTSGRGEEGAQPVFLFFENSYKEAERIARKIKEARDSGTDFHRQAVLFRSAYVSIPLQAELTRRDIPFQVFGGVKFYETAHAKDIMAHLKILQNFRDELSWSRALMLLEGVGPRGAERMLEDILLASGFLEACEALESHSSGSRHGEGIRRLAALLRDFHGSSPKRSVSETYRLVNQYYEPIFRSKFDDWPKRLGDLVVLQEIAGRYSGLDEFLADFVIEPPRLGPRFSEENNDEKPLVLSTIHSAKGLEWEDVYFIGLLEGVLPSGFAFGRDDEIEEEQRLFYVGVTRAKRNLYLSASYMSSRGGAGSGEISRFLSAPNVISKLRQEFYGNPSTSLRENFEEDEDGIGPVSAEKAVFW
ncbi:MAG: ATP-dependent helicase [Nanoarchaeota archaeon]|nr:ATP-dependent helicase [Nanoarchaeota archaeon]